MATKLIKVFDLPKGCSIKRIALRETDGNDERIAMRQLQAKNRGESTLTLELLALGIVAYWTPDGKKHARTDDAPMYVFDDWTTKTRTQVRRCFDSLNETAAAEGDPLDSAVLAGPDGEPIPVAGPPATDPPTA